MKRIRNVVVLGLALACSAVLARTNQTRDLPSFSAIAVEISSHVIIKQGSPQSVRLEGDAKDLDKIDTKVRGDELVIKTFKSSGWNNNLGQVTIYITVPDLESVAVSGSGDVTSDGRIKSEFLELRVSGSGDIELEAEAEEMESKISGSGRIVLSGNTGSNKVTISGSGRVRAEELRAKECTVRISGSGNCRIDVSERLEVSVSGSGNVSYKGDPKKVYSNISGSGNLLRLD